MEITASRYHARRTAHAVDSALIAALRPLHALISAPDLCFVAALLVMLFRPPDLQFYSIDRIAFLLLIGVVVLRVLALRQPLRILRPVTWPMLGLLLLCLKELLAQPYDPANWSLFVAKWLVPFVLFQLSGFVFDSPPALRTLEIFSLVIFAYLCLIAVFFLIDAKSLIFPRYILDEGLGIHIERARGPFLNAVANGVTLNLLGLIALDAFRRRKLAGPLALLFAISFPLAILATKTRAVWISCAASILLLLVRSRSLRIRRACFGLTCTAGIAILILFCFSHDDGSINARLQESSPVEFRMGMYRAGWDMFLDKPLFGWKAERIQQEIGRRVTDFHPERFLFHNTYLEIAVEHGALGLALYLWTLIDLFRLAKVRRSSPSAKSNGFMDDDFRSLWPLMVGVYLLNASLVVMNYQFVNGLLFTMAGTLAAQNSQAEDESRSRGGL
jgi:O-antigen ligase